MVFTALADFDFGGALEQEGSGGDGGGSGTLQYVR